MKKINIPIHKHTPKRYRQSIYRTDTQYNYTTGSGNWVALVTDLQRVYKIKNANITGYTPYKSLADELNKMPIGFWRNLWQNKIRWWK